MEPDAYDICADLYGDCRCKAAGRDPCDAMMDMADNGETADDERKRMDSERDDAKEWGHSPC